MADLATFPILSGKDLERIKVDETMQKFERRVTTGPLISGFRRLRFQDGSGNWKNTTEYKEWKAVRNILAHRAAYGRIFVEGSGTSDLWRVENIPFDDKLTSSRRMWLVSTLTELLQGTKDYADAHL